MPALAAAAAAAAISFESKIEARSKPRTAEFAELNELEIAVERGLPLQAKLDTLRSEVVALYRK